MLSEPPDSVFMLPASRFDQPRTSRLTSINTDTTSIRLLLISDTHSEELFPLNSDNAFRHPLPSADLLIHAGDLTDTGLYEEHLTTFKLIASHSAPTKLVIPGNHDLTLDKDYFVTREQTPSSVNHVRGHQARSELWKKCMDLWTSEEARKQGVIMCIDEGVREVIVRGTKIRIYATPYTPYFGNWAFSYQRKGEGEDRFNGVYEGSRSRIPEDVDIIVSHGPPGAILDEAMGRSLVSVGCESLVAAARRVRPLLHVFGHIHEGYGVLRVDWTKGSGLGEGTIWRAGNADLERFSDRSYEKRKKVNRVAVSNDKSRNVEQEDKYMNLVIDGPNLKRDEETLFVNAAIMTRWNQPKNAPWVVDLDIPCRVDGTPKQTNLEALQSNI